MALTKAAGGEKMTLVVVAENQPAIALYNKLGFELEGHSKKSFKTTDGRYLDDYMMARFL